MVTIAAPRAWALGTLRQRSWMSHVLTVGTWPWRCCAPDTSSLDVGVSPLLCPVLVPLDGVELAAGDRRSPPPPLPSPWSARAGGVPETGDPEPLDSALQEIVTAPLLPPEEGRVENLLFPFCSVPPLTPGSIKEQFPFPPGPKRARMAVYETSSPHSRPPLSSPVGSRVRGRDAFSRIPCPTMEPGQCHTTHSDPTSSPCAPFRCPTVGTSVTPLVPLVRSLGAWLELPRPSRWLLRTIRLGYAIQFARRPPKFRGIRFTSVLSKDAPVLRAEVAVLLAKDAIEPYLCLEAYGILSRYHAARIASYETASALASRPGPEMGMAPRHIPGLTHPVLPSHLQPLVGPCVSSGRSAPRASIQACCCFNRRLCHGLGGRVQRARSRGALDRAPAAVAYQLPRVAGSMACSAPLQNAATREACTGPLGQHCDRCVHQPPGRSTLPSHVATRPPSLPLESEASEVASRRSCPRRAQPCSRRALTSARPSGRMATPPRGTPADLETLRGRSGRPVCLPGHVSLPVVFLPVRGDPRYRCAGMQLASGLTQICVSPSEPSHTDPVQGQGGRGASPLGGALLAQPDVVSRTDAPRDSPSLANSSEEGSTFSERGHPLAPAPRLVESPRMVLGRDAEVLSGLPPAVVNTIASARALSTRQAYRLKWNLFVDWCSPRREDPVDARSQSCSLSCRMGWSKGCLPPPSKSMSPLSPHTTMQ